MLNIKSSQVSCDFEKFFEITLRYIQLPNAVNKKICGGIIEKCLKLQSDSIDINLENPPSLDSKVWSDLEETSLEQVTVSDSFIVISRILPKDVGKRTSFHIGCIYSRRKFKFIRFTSEESGLLPQFPYEMSFDDGHFELFVTEGSGEVYERSITWMENILFDKLQRWMTTDENKKETRRIKSLSLVDVEEYTQTYSDLKSKYGPKLLDMWPECTDPKKYVFEDIAIASYLIVLWRSRYGPDKKVSFVDLGCGNGLLVHILSSEGHAGEGIDLRSRKIWNLYPGEPTLKVETIIPSGAGLFPHADWIIGNHSDELSPWIPVICARNSPNSHFFLLPCCAFEFSGKKFQRTQSGKSVYESFIEYAMQISTMCGFKFDVDRLKIASTKRIAIVSNERLPYDERNLQEFIDASGDFTPRVAKERVKNCTTIDKSVETTIVLRIFNELLSKKRFLEKFPHWNIGGSLHLGDAIKLIPDDLKRSLKAECGGLQTLLKNNYNIFEVREGNVRIREPIDVAERQKTQPKNFKLRQKPCWFLENHPNGCPFSEELCTFQH